MLLPPEFEQMLAELGDAGAGVVEALQAGVTVPTAVRLNRSKAAPALTGRPVAWCESGLLLDERPQFTLDPALHQGRYYVQDSSSMAATAAVARALELLDRKENLRYLDACAAPGGKTIAALDTLPPDTFAVANEYDPRRAAILAENLAKHGSGRVATMRGDASSMQLPANFFDIIGADVPCSGEGMMGKEEEAVNQWSPGLVAQCALLQRSIVDNLWDALAPGGFLVYSTCTFNTSENESVVAHAVADLGAEVMDIPALDLPCIAGSAEGFNFPAYRFLPGRTPGHGQFVALLRKPSDAGLRASAREVKTDRKKTVFDAAPYLAGEWVTRLRGDIVTALPAAHTADVAAMEKHAKNLKAGIELGQIKGRDFIPSQELALAVDLRHDAFARVDVDIDTALSYLRRNPVTLPDGAPRGIVLLTYQDTPLGFVKNLGNRANNLYPQHWRIRN